MINNLHFIFLLYQRHVVTAAHCICPRKKKHSNDGIHFQYPHSKSLCKEPYDRQNQITPGFNDITIYGGHKDLDLLNSLENKENTFSTVHAFIKNGPSLVPPYKIDSKDDIGLLVSDRALFDKNRLKNTQPLERPPIIPICLVAENADFSNEKMMGVGWGYVYDEAPTRTNNEDPYYSSCMTNEVGPKKYAFEPCDMNWIKKEIRVNNKIKKEAWACDKNNYPDEVQKVAAKCKYYFRKARKILDDKQIRVMENVDMIHIHGNIDKIDKQEFNSGLFNDLDTPILTCYKEKKFKENGWCKLRRSSRSWGFCSPSCDEDLLRVSK